MAFEPTEREREWLIALGRAEPFSESDEAFVRVVGRSNAEYGDLYALLMAQVKINSEIVQALLQLRRGDDIPPTLLENIIQQQRRLLSIIDLSFKQLVDNA